VRSAQKLYLLPSECQYSLIGQNSNVILYFNLKVTNDQVAHQTLSLFQVANLACSISNNEEGVKLVRMAATQIDSLCPQVKDLVFSFLVPLVAVLYDSDK